MEGQSNVYKVIKADKDAYVTDRVIGGSRVYNANVGIAGSLDLFKLYGITLSGSSPNIELSRALIHFDLSSLVTMMANGAIDINSDSFDCRLKLFDVYGGQPCPSNFDITVNPLSQSFDEGVGKDSTFYTDIDVCNFLTASRPTGVWLLSGANFAGDASGPCDYVTIANGTNMSSTQHFVSGEEDLYVDVTKMVSATLAGLVPSAGFRVALAASHETDQRTYFVKRFASRHAYNYDKHPRLIVRFNDSVFDDSQTMEFDIDNALYLRNYSRGSLRNLTSSSIDVTGPNCLKLKMITEISGGTYDLLFSGSQVGNSAGYVTGTYSAVVNISSTDPTIHSLLSASNSLGFYPVWITNDKTHAYYTGSATTVSVQQRTSDVIRGDYIVSAMGIRNEHFSDENVLIEVTIFDVRTPYNMIMRIPAETPSEVIHDVFYAVRDTISQAYVIPFDTDKNSTQLSADGATGMFFNLDMSAMTPGHQYTIDILIKSRGGSYIYKSVAPTFKVINAL